MMASIIVPLFALPQSIPNAIDQNVAGRTLVASRRGGPDRVAGAAQAC
jgi:hypothetical protein